MIAGIKKRFNSRRKVDREFAATTSVGSLFQMCGAAIVWNSLPDELRDDPEDSSFR